MSKSEERGGTAMEGFPMDGSLDELLDFSDENLLDSIDFGDLFVGMEGSDTSLPDLEMDPNILAEFSGKESGINKSRSASCEEPGEEDDEEGSWRREEEDKVSASGLGPGPGRGEEILSTRDDDSSIQSRMKENDKRTPSVQSKNCSHGKRKLKVDWTPELHRRFVQAVEQLGVDKAVPSRILELMGIDCLTRHNIASHLQKYRSHRKHLLAREAEAANWSQKRHLYSGTSSGGGGSKRDVSPWHAPPPTPMMGFPPMTTPMHHFRPLHVWGHPSMDRSPIHMWPKQIAPTLPYLAPHVWPATVTPHHAPPPAPASNPSFWHSHHQRVQNSFPPGAPYFLPPLAVRFQTPPSLVPGVLPPSMYKVAPGIGVPATPAGPSSPHSPFDFHPSNESIDAAIGDILSKPWQPLPLGLKPPALDSVLVELQRQGIQKVPPRTTVPACGQ